MAPKTAKIPTLDTNPCQGIGEGEIVKFSPEKRPGRHQKQPYSLRAAINSKCKSCIHDPINTGTWRQQVEACTSPTCPLFEVRPVSRTNNIAQHK